MSQDNNVTTYWAWTSADCRWTTSGEATERLDTFVEIVSKLEDVKLSKKKSTSICKKLVAFDFYYVKITFPSSCMDAIWEAAKTAGVAFSNVKIF